MLASPRGRSETGLLWQLLGILQLPLSMPQHESSEHPAPLTPCHGMALHLGWEGPEKTWPWDIEATQSQGELRWGRGGHFGTYSSSTSEAGQVSDGLHSTTANLPTHTRNLPRNPSAQERSFTQDGGGGSRGQWPPVSDKGGLQQRLHLSTAVDTYTCCASDLWPRTLLLQLLWGKSPWAERRKKYTLKRNRASSRSTLRASAPGTWDQTPTSDRAVMATEQRRSPTSCPVLALAPLPGSPSTVKVIATSTHWGKT